MSLLATAGIFNTLPVEGGGGGGISIVAVSGGNQVTSGAGTENISIPGSPLEGDCVIVIRGCDNTLSSAGTSGYSTVTTDSGSDTMGWMIEEKRMGSTPDSVVAIPQTTKLQPVIIAVIRGVHATFLDVAIPTPPSGNTATISPPEITTATDGALLMGVAMLDDDDSDVSAFPSGYTNTAMAKTTTGDGSNGASNGVAFKAIPTATTETPGSFTFASVDFAIAFSIAIKPA